MNDVFYQRYMSGFFHGTARILIFLLVSAVAGGLALLGLLALVWFGYMMGWHRYGFYPAFKLLILFYLLTVYYLFMDGTIRLSLTFLENSRVSISESFKAFFQIKKSRSWKKIRVFLIWFVSIPLLILFFWNSIVCLLNGWTNDFFALPENILYYAVTTYREAVGYGSIVAIFQIIWSVAFGATVVLLLSCSIINGMRLLSFIHLGKPYSHQVVEIFTIALFPTLYAFSGVALMVVLLSFLYTIGYGSILGVALILLILLFDVLMAAVFLFMWYWCSIAIANIALQDKPFPKLS